MFKRKRRYLIVCICAFLFSCSSNDSSQQTQNIEIDTVTTFGGTKNDNANSVISTEDGGYAIVGFTQSNDGDINSKTNESFDYWVLKFDANNNVQWQKTYGGTNDDRASDIIQTTEGGYAIIGFSFSNDLDVSENNGLQDFWMTKLDASGNISWEKSFGFSGVDPGVSIIQTQDSGYLLSGVLDVTASGGEGNSRNASSKHAGGDYWLIKLNASGEKQWSRFFGGTFNDNPFDVIETNDNSFIVVGTSDSTDVDISNNIGSDDFWILKISQNGDLIWEKNFGGQQIDIAYAIAPTTDGNFVIAGETLSNDQDISINNGGADLWIIKINPDGDLLWEKTLGGNNFDSARSINTTQDNGFILSGNSRSSNGDLEKNNGQNDGWLLKLDNNANIEWQKTVGGSNTDFFNDAVQLNDGTFIAVGESSSSDFDIIENKGFSDLLIVKLK